MLSVKVSLIIAIISVILYFTQINKFIHIDNDNDSMNKLPTIDYQCLLSKNETCISELANALQNVGFFVLRNHNVPIELIKNLERTSKDFFQLDDKDKEKISMKNGGRAWRGYFKVGNEYTSNVPDLKEGIYLGVEHNSTHPRVIKRTPTFGNNLWPNNELKKIATEYLNHNIEIGHNLLKSIALGLKLEENYLHTRFTDEPTVLFRIFNYPSVKRIESKPFKYGVGEHTDYGCLTILWFNSDGLEVKTRAGNWIKVKKELNPGDFVINIGDMLEFWTHGFLRATPHRVVLNNDIEDRLSFPVFFDPSWMSSLQPIPKHQLPMLSVNDITYKKYKRWDGNQLDAVKHMLYGQFLWSKISQVFPELAENLNIKLNEVI